MDSCSRFRALRRGPSMRRALRLEGLERRELLAAQIVISEFLASNQSGLRDGHGRYSDWIELHNSGDQSADLSLWHLTDDPNDLDQWTMPAGAASTLAAGEYLIVFASGDATPDPGGNLHTNFGLSASGDYLALVRPDLTIASEYGQDAAEYPEQRSDVSYGIDFSIGGDGTESYFLTPTPGAANADPVMGFVADTSFSVDRGYFDESFSVELNSATLGATLVYTTDGSEPSLTNGTQVFVGSNLAPTASVPVMTTTTLRAAAFKTGFEPTNIDTQTYLFLSDVVAQPNDPNGFPSGWGTAPAADYGMDPQVTDDPSNSDDLLTGLAELPAFSLVSDTAGIFGAGGIYSNPQNGNLEVPVSAEYLLPDGTSGFQIDAGLKIAGGASRNPNNSPKHSMTLRFRSNYGDSKLDYDLFDGSPVNEFNSLQLRAIYNNSWIHWDQGQRGRGTLIRDQFIRDSLIAAGQDDAGRGHYTHVYINGLYWGVYNLHERADSSHFAEHNGGDSEDYDALNGATPIDGDLTSWNELKSIAASGDWIAVQQALDVDNFIDWTLVQMYGGNADLKLNGNWRAAGGGQADAPWRMYAWDSERVLEGTTAKPPHTITDATGMFDDLMSIPEFVVRFGDRIQKHYTGNGAFTPDNSIDRWNQRADQLRHAIVAESARWGDYRRDVHPRGETPLLYRRDQNWTPEVNRLVSTYFPARTDFVVGQFVDLGWMPPTAPPELLVNGEVNFGGQVAPGSSLTLAAEAGTIYYTIDGTDPRQEVGGINPDASVYTPGSSPAIVLDESIQVRSRARNASGEWSALQEALFLVPNESASAVNLRLTEINYNPVEGSDAEFIEIRNITSGGDAVTIDLDGVTVTDGPSVPFVFPVNTKLLPGQSGLLVRDVDLFLAVYPDVDSQRILGEYSGKLSNDGERIRILGADATVIVDLQYGTGSLWPKWADGIGGTLVLDDADGVSIDRLGKPYSYRGSVPSGGTPGDVEPSVPSVVVSEVLAHTDSPLTDSIEFYNHGDSAIDVGGWFFSDDGEVPGKYRIDDGTIIDAGGYLLFDASDFNPSLPNANSLIPFALNAGQGDSVWLFSGDGTVATGLVDHASFDATFNGVSLGLIPGSGGRIVPLANRSLGGINGMFLPSDLVISEINFHPASPTPEALVIAPTIDDDDLEFIEITNATDHSVDLANWRLRGEADFDFAATESLMNDESIAVVSFDPDAAENVDLTAAFRAHYAINSSVRLVGPFSGGLSNSHGLVKLQAPDQPSAETPTVFPHVTVDEVLYDDLAPWPLDADGGGASLQRVAASTLGMYVDSWRGEAPTPGNVPARALVETVVINGGEAERSMVDQIEVHFDRLVDVSEDAFELTHRESQTIISSLHVAALPVGGKTVATITFPAGPLVVVRPGGSNSLIDGNYELRVRAQAIHSAGTDATMASDHLFGADASDAFFRLFGDSDGDRDVDGTDYGRFGLTFLKSLGQSGYNRRLDYDGDGDVDGQDYGQFGLRFLSSLPH